MMFLRELIRAVKAITVTALLIAAVTSCAKRSNQPTSMATVSDPPPQFHQHPEVPPDEISTRPDESGISPDAGTQVEAKPLAECTNREVPPLAPAVRRRIRSGPPITNSIAAEVVMRPIRARLGCFRNCYERALTASPNLEGRVAIRFVVDEDGWVRRTRIWKSDLADAQVAQCLAQEFVGLKYPPPERKITVIYPLALSPKWLKN